MDVFIPQYAKQGALELHYDFFKFFFDADRFGELEMETDSLYLGLWEENMEDVSVAEKRDQWNALHQKIAEKFILQMQ